MNDEDKADLDSLMSIIKDMQERHGKGLMEDDEEETEDKPKGSLAAIVSKSVGKKKGDEAEEYE